MNCKSYILWSLIAILFQTVIAAQSDVMTLNNMEWRNYTSGAWQSDEIEEYIYNENGQLVYAILSSWNSSQQSYQYNSRIQTIYANEQVSAKIYADYDISTGLWQDTLKRVYTYNTSQLLSMLETYQKPADSEDWEKETKEEYFYDAVGSLIEFYFYEWDTDISDWANYEKNVYAYDVDGNMTQFTSWIWDYLFKEWLYFDKEEYTYEEDWIKYAYSEYNEMSEGWEYIFKDSSMFSTDGLKYAYLSCYWDNSTSQWVNFSKEIHDLNAEGKILSYAEYEWNENTMRWDYYDKEEYTYDTYGNVTLFIDYNKSNEYNVWVESLKEIYEYDHSYNLNQLIIPYDEPVINGVYFNTMLLSIDAFDWNSGISDWKVSSKGLFAYSQFNTGTSSLSPDERQVEIYPVPFTDFIIVSNAESTFLTIYDIKGMVYKQMLINSENQVVNTQSFVPGLYFIQLQDKYGQKAVRKVLKR